MKARNPHLGSALDDLLREDDALEEVEARSQKRVVARQLERLMKDRGITKAALASRMRTSRSALDRLLDPDNDQVKLETLSRAAKALGRKLASGSDAAVMRPMQERVYQLMAFGVLFRGGSGLRSIGNRHGDEDQI